MIVGMLGGIGSGKSTVAGLLANEGVTVIDADCLARDAMDEPGTRSGLREWLGDSLCPPEGPVDRAGIAARVFGHSEELARLESILHPRVLKRIEEVLARFRSDERRGRPDERILVLDVPLLVETGLDRQCDELLFVDSDLEERSERSLARGWPPGEVRKREEHQVPLEKKRQLATRVISNSGSREQTRQQVEELIGRLRPTGRGASPSRRRGAPPQ